MIAFLQWLHTFVWGSGAEKSGDDTFVWGS